MKANSFDNIGGEKFDLNRLPYRFYDELQEMFGRIIHKYCKQNNIIKPEIIDLGSGTGYTTKAVLMYNPNAHITCVDQEEIMIEQAEEILIESIKPKNVNFKRSKIESYLPRLKSESIDGIVTCSALHNNNKYFREYILRESYRILKRKGIFVWGDKIGPDDPEEYADEFAQLLINHKILLEKGENEAYDYWIRHNMFDNQDELMMKESYVEDLINNVGFTNVEKVWEENMTRIYVGYKE